MREPVSSGPKLNFKLNLNGSKSLSHTRCFFDFIFYCKSGSKPYFQAYETFHIEYAVSNMKLDKKMDQKTTLYLKI